MANATIAPMVRGETRSLLEADTANELIGAVNKVLRLEIRFIATGGSRLEIGGENAVAYISTKDINLGLISGAKGGNAALASLLTRLGTTFTLDDRTT